MADMKRGRRHCCHVKIYLWRALRIFLYCYKIPYLGCIVIQGNSESVAKITINLIKQIPKYVGITILIRSIATMNYVKPFLNLTERHELVRCYVTRYKHILATFLFH